MMHWQGLQCQNFKRIYRLGAHRPLLCRKQRVGAEIAGTQPNTNGNYQDIYDCDTTRERLPSPTTNQRPSLPTIIATLATTTSPEIAANRLSDVERIP